MIPSGARPTRAAAAIIVILAVVAVVLVAWSLQRPNPLTFEPSPVMPTEVGERLVGPIQYTVDARSADEWRYFSFAKGSVVEAPGAREWDLAFRRYHVIANGGERFAGMAGVAPLGSVPFDSVTVVPETGYHETIVRSDSTNAGFGKWYDYGFISHLLTPRPVTYAIRTADGRYAKLELISYYCPGAQPGCVTFRYVYQGDGTRNVRPVP